MLLLGSDHTEASLLPPYHIYNKMIFLKMLESTTGVPIPTNQHNGEIHIKLGKLVALVDNLFSIFETVYGIPNMKFV